MQMKLSNATNLIMSVCACYLSYVLFLCIYSAIEDSTRILAYPISIARLCIALNQFREGSLSMRWGDTSRRRGDKNFGHIAKGCEKLWTCCEGGEKIRRMASFFKVCVFMVL